MFPDIGITGRIHQKMEPSKANSLGQIQIVTSNSKYCAIKDLMKIVMWQYLMQEKRNCNVIVEITLTVNQMVEHMKEAQVIQHIVYQQKTFSSGK